MVQEYKATELLHWYVESGIDESLENEPVNRFETPSAPKVEPSPKKTIPIVTPIQPARPAESKKIMVNLVSRNEAIKSAHTSANASNSLRALREALEAFEGCPIKQTAKNLVFGSGPTNASLMFIGGCPGAQEDREGLPFVGREGQLMDRMLAAISLKRSDAYITNILPWRPPGNRTPTDAEIAPCIPFIERQIELVSPRVLVLVGGTSAKELLGTSKSIMRTRGKWFEYSRKSLRAPIPTRAILHPEYLIRIPAQKRETWIDLLEIQQRLKIISDNKEATNTNNSGITNT